MQLLHKGYLFAPSIHCGYYSCIQKIKHILEEYYTEEYENEVNSLRFNKKGIHSILINLFYPKINDRRDSRDLKNMLTKFRDLRVDSDYKELDVTSEKSEKARRYMLEIHKLIRKHMQL